jgi:hypothetical protein
MFTEQIPFEGFDYKMQIDECAKKNTAKKSPSEYAPISPE